MILESIPEYKYDCKKCGERVGRLDPGVGPHYAKWTCPCGMIAWLSKPKDDATKYRREGTHKDLVIKYGSGYCQMCLREEGAIRDRKGETLEAHHILPYQYNGDSSRENIWIVCTSCHKYIEHVRRYINDPVRVKTLVESVLLTVKPV